MRMLVRRDDLTALLRNRDFSLVRIRFFCDLMFATWQPSGFGVNALRPQRTRLPTLPKSARRAQIEAGRASDDNQQMLEITEVADDKSLRACLEVIHVAFGTVAAAHGWTRDTVPDYTAFLPWADYQAQARSGGRVFAAVRDGRAAVQDVGSQLLALALAEAEVRGGGSGVGVETPERWLDLCAGPGGKAGVLAGLAVAAGADLTAVEVSPHRADLVRSSLRAMTEYAADSGRSIEVRTADGREIGEAEPTVEKL